MNQEAKNLFLKNYFNEGDCEGLMDKTKIIEKEFRKTGQVKTIRYLHWALVERIFRLQGGTFEVKSWNFEVPFITKTQAYDENGEFTTKEEKQSALFLHLSANWMGETLEEHYPIFDNQTSRIIALPDAQDLNTAKQRGMVRLIARISGIGLSIFEQLEDQFAKDDEGTKIIQEPKQPSMPEQKEKTKVEKKSKTEKKLENIPTAEPTPVVEETDDSNVFLEMMKGEKVAIDHAPTAVSPKVDVEDYDKDTEQYADKKLAIKKFISTHQKTILDFMASKGASLLGDLTYAQLVELESIVKADKK
jgi:hypothetical protein